MKNKYIIITVLFVSNAFTMEQTYRNPEVFSLKAYRSLSHNDIQTLNNEFEATFNQQMILKNPANIDELIATARELNNRYKNSVIVSLGQSPAYIVKAAEILNELENNKYQNEYKYLAFSGRFLSKNRFPPSYEEEEPYPNKIFYQSPRYSLPTENQLEAYKKYLKLLKLDPIEITNRFNKSQIPTVFVEYMQHGESLASFLYTLNAIAATEGINKELFKKATKYYTFQPQQFGSSIISEISVNIPPYPSASLENAQLANNRLMIGLANADIFHDRLVPNYPNQDWIQVNPNQFIPSNNAKLVIFKIINHVINEKSK